MRRSMLVLRSARSWPAGLALRLLRRSPSRAAIREERRLAVEQQLARHGADGRVGERGDELPQRVRREGLPRIGEHDDVECRPFDAGIQRERLAALRNDDELDVRRVPAGHGRRIVGGAVGDDNDLPACRRIVERPQVLQPCAEARAFVMSGDDDGHSGQPLRCGFVSSAVPVLPGPGPQLEDQRVSGVDIRHEADREPEQQLHDDHAALSAS